MLRGNWLHYCAIGGCLALALSWHHPSYARPDYQKDTAADQTPVAAIPPGDTPASADHYEPSCGAPKNYDEASLCEDFRANAHAETFDWINLGLAILGIIGLFANWYYMHQTTEATIIAAKAAADANEGADEQARIAAETLEAAKQNAIAAQAMAEASKEAAGIQKQMMIAGSRAYLSPTGGVFTPLLDDATGRFNGVIVSMGFRNVGKTQAREYRSVHIIQKLYGAIPAGFMFDRPDERTLPRSVMPDEEFVFKWRLTRQEIEAIATDRLSVLIYCFIEYRDIFDDTPPRMTETTTHLVPEGALYENDVTKGGRMPRLASFVYGGQNAAN